VGVAEAHAKLLLFGEHAAVYGAPAVGLGLPWALRVESRPGPDWSCPGLGPHRASVETLVGRLATLGGQRGLRAPDPATLRFTSEIPLGSGFGSSGALCAALVNLFWPDQPLAVREQLAWEAEAQFHGSPSGIDTALALRQGWWALDASVRPAAARPLADPGLTLVAGGLVREDDTKALVAGLARRREAGDVRVVGALTGLADLARRAIELLDKQTPSGLPRLVNEARILLQGIDLESPSMTRVLDAAPATGAVAGKLSGAGGGGAFVLVYPDRTTAEAALSALRSLVSEASWTCVPRLV